MEGNRNKLSTPFLIVKDGKPEASIVIRCGADEKTVAAANDLQNIIFRMSGAELPIKDDAFPVAGNKISLGITGYSRSAGINGKISEVKGESVILKREGDILYLLGNDSGIYTGTQFAVNMLLEKLGCGWYGPDELWQVIPEKKDISVEYMNTFHTPQFNSRYTRVAQFCPEVGMRWYCGGDKTDVEHAYGLMFPREQYFEEHPEWYCMHNGKRDPYNNRSPHLQSWQMCYSNDELAAETAARVIKFFDEHPEYGSFSLAANDGMYEGFCECEKCAEMGTPGEIMVKFINKVAKITAEKYPDKTLYFFVYFPTFDPPESKIKAEPNLQIMFCKESCMYHPVDEGPSCGYHEDYEFEFRYSKYPRPWRETFEKWIEMTDLKNICIWEWYCPAACVTSWKDLPWVQGDIATRNQRFWKENGAEFVYYDQGPNKWYNDPVESFPLRWPLWYVAAKGCWDGKLTGTDILSDACEKLYEQAADQMLSYYLALADTGRKCYAKNIAWQSAEPYEFYTPEAIERIGNTLRHIEDFKGVVSEKAWLRIENQLSLWKRCVEAVEESKNGSEYRPIY